MIRLLAVVALALCPAPSFAKRYTLEEAIAKVTSDYPGVVAARASLDAAMAQLSQSQRGWAPSGDLSFSITGHPEAKCADATGFINPDKETRERNCVSTNISDFSRYNGNLAAAAPFNGVLLNLAVNVWQPLYTFGKIEANIESSKHALEAARAAVGIAQADVVYNVTRAYWGLKAARAGLATLDEGLEKLDEWVDKLDQELAGANKHKYAESDLSRLKIGVDQVRIIRLDVEKQHRYATAALRLLTDDPEATIDDDEIDLLPFDDRRAEDYAETMVRRRPEALQTAAATRQVGAARKLRLAEMLPDLHLWTRFEYGYASGLDSPANYFFWRPTYLKADFLLTLRMPLDFGPRYFRLVQARADERAAKAREAAAIETWSIEVYRGWADVREAVGRVKSAKHAEKIARGWYNSVDQASSSGVSDGKEFADAARIFFEYRLRYIQAMFDANSMIALLERTVGTTAVRRGE